MTAPKKTTAKTPATPAAAAEKEIFVNGKKLTDTTKISYVANPKRSGSKAHARYEAYVGAKTVAEYFKMNDSKSAMADLRHDDSKGFLKIES